MRFIDCELRRGACIPGDECAVCGEPLTTEDHILTHTLSVETHFTGSVSSSGMKNQRPNLEIPHARSADLSFRRERGLYYPSRGKNLTLATCWIQLPEPTDRLFLRPESTVESISAFEIQAMREIRKRRQHLLWSPENRGDKEHFRYCA
jgi:hypothetical protein